MVQRIPWLRLTALTLLAVLLAVAWAQARQFSLLRQAVGEADDFAVISVHQTEAGYLRLLSEWHRVNEAPRGLDNAELGSRFEIWVSRIRLLREGRVSDPVTADPADAAALQLAEAFIRKAAPALGAIGPDWQDDSAPHRARLQALLPELEALGSPLHAMTLSAAQRVADHAEARTQAVQKLSTQGWLLTALLSVLTLGFAYFALSQVRQLRQQRVAMEVSAEHLRQARREAIAASEAKSAFLANMSHEIRTPFQGLIGMLSLLREGGLSAKQSEQLHIATESADHLLALLNDILDLSQLEGGNLRLAPGSVDLRSLLRETEALMRPQAAAKNLALHVDVDPDVPELCHADVTRLRQILFNLLSNAIKFSQRGEVVLKLSRRRSAAGTAMLSFSVSDTGEGMDEATMARLFNRFMQADSSRSRRHGGTGLGLEISRNLARLMRGDIAVHSRLGEGSKFTFSLPLLSAEAAPTALAAARSDGTHAPRALHVMVAEDHPVNREYMGALLARLGHVAHFAFDGREALTAAATRRFDLVLMDLHMPHMDGIAATQAIRALPDANRSTVPILALTADAFEATEERCIEAGMNGFLRKPLKPQELDTALRRLFGAELAPAPPIQSHPLSHAGADPAVLDIETIQRATQALSDAEYARLAKAYLDQVPGTVQRMRSAVRDAETLELRAISHATRGAALNLGLSALAATAEALQQGAAHLPAHEIARLVQRFAVLELHTRQALQSAGLWPATAAQKVLTESSLTE